MASSKPTSRSTTPPPHPVSSSPDVDFEKAVEDVEGIIRRIEAGEIGLEQSLAEYERGTRLLGVCREWLTRAEQRVRDLSAEMKKGGGSGGDS